MAENLGLYPHSTTDGEPIPFDIIRPAGLIAIPVTDTVTSPIVIPVAAELTVFYATCETIIAFATTAVADYSGTFQAAHMFIPANTLVCVDHNGAANFTAIAVRDGGGHLFMIGVTKWKDIRKSTQFTRG